MLSCAAVVACKSISVDTGQVVALVTSVPDSGIIQACDTVAPVVCDTIQPSAKALTAGGDTVAATIFWQRLDTTVLVVDSASGKTVGLIGANVGRIQARVGNLISSPITLTILPALDSIGAQGATIDSISAAALDSLSDSFTVRAFAAIGPRSLTARPIILSDSTFPAGVGSFTLLPKDTVLTDGSGAAVFQVRFVGGSLPDSVVVLARSYHLDGSPVYPDSVRYVVVFVP